MQQWMIFGLTFLVMACDKPVDKDKDGFFDNEECDDSNPAISPKATDLVGDGYDQNCDGIDGTDADGDGVASVLSGGVDCDDDNPEVKGQSAFYQDLDADGFGNPDQEVMSCEAPVGFVEDNSDCNDGAFSVNPEALEVCDGLDNDCDDSIDDDDDSVEGQFALFLDADGDRYGDAAEPVSTCDWTTDLVENADDCDDQSSDVHPMAEEILGDGIDNDCDSLELCFEDLDSDGYGTDVTMLVNLLELDVTSCTEVEGASILSGDCDDSNAAVSPEALEVCDDIDNDCDGLIDDGDDSTDLTTGMEYMMDLDEDGFGYESNLVMACEQSSTMSTIPGDCNDQLASTNPLATDIVGDGTDQNCDGVDGFDFDGDGFASIASGGDDCNDADGATGSSTDFDGDGYTCQEDCNDADGTIHPGAPEIVGDGIDQDCNGNDAAQSPLFADINDPTDETLQLLCGSYNTVFGDLSIDMTNLTSNSTESLSCLTAVYGRLEITNINSSSIIAFDHLTTVGDLDLSGGETYDFPVLMNADSIAITSNQSSDFNGDDFFPMLTSISGVFSWSYGSSIDISGFSQLTTLGTLDVQDDLLLEDVSGFANITELESMVIRNTELFDITGGSFESINSLTIRNNDLLENTSGLQNLISTIILDIRNDDILQEDGCMYFTDDTNLLLSDVTFNGFSVGQCDLDEDGMTGDAGDCDDQDSLLEDYDFDNDGFSTCDGDCEDGDASINPGATDAWYDGIDSDCDGANDFDQDGDTDIAFLYGGSDCDDNDITMNGLDFDGDGLTSCDGDALEPVESCREWLDLGLTQSGVYPLLFANGGTMDVYCEMDMHEGGWTLYAVTDSFECAEELAYGGNELLTFDNPYFAMSLKDMTHTEFMQDVRVGALNTDFSIVWEFLDGVDTVENRFMDAYNSGVPVHWTVAFGNADYAYSGSWWFSNSAFVNNWGGNNPWSQGSGTSFSDDDGTWGAANGTVDGNSDVAPLWGQSVLNSNDGSDCGHVYINGTVYSSNAIQNRMYFR